MAPVILINKIPSCFSTVRKEDGSKVQGEWRGHSKQGPERGLEALSPAESAPCFFLLNDSHAEANGSKMQKLFPELPDELMVFVVVFQFHFSFLGNMRAVFSIPGGGFFTSFKCPGEEGLSYQGNTGYFKCYSYSLNFLVFFTQVG